MILNERRCFRGRGSAISPDREDRSERPNSVKNGPERRKGRRAGEKKRGKREEPAQPKRDEEDPKQVSA